MKAYKLEVLIIDFDGHGSVKAVQDALENGRFANRCIYPHVMRGVEADVGEWDDSHPLNNRDTALAEYDRIFSKASANSA